MRWKLWLLIACWVSPAALAGVLPEVCGQLLVSDFEDVAVQPPTSVAGPDQQAPRGRLVSLDGSSSSGGGSLGYCWEFLSRLADSQASLSDPLAVAPNFVADQPGDYLLRLTTFEGMVAGAADLVWISTRGIDAAVVPGVGEQLVSADYALTMDIAAGALAMPTSVGIQLLADSDVSAVLQQAGAESVYELNPTGQNYTAPVALNWRQPRQTEIAPRETGG